jgi:hypothetical protein
VLEKNVAREHDWNNTGLMQKNPHIIFLNPGEED